MKNTKEMEGTWNIQNIGEIGEMEKKKEKRNTWEIGLIREAADPI